MTTTQYRDKLLNMDTAYVTGTMTVQEFVSLFTKDLRAQVGYNNTKVVEYGTYLLSRVGNGYGVHLLDEGELSGATTVLPTVFTGFVNLNKEAVLTAFFTKCKELAVLC